VLFIYGGSDPWVPVEQSLSQIRELAKQQPNVHHVVIPNANHEMTFVERETMPSDEKTLKEIAPTSPEYFVVLASWLCKQINN
jgi:uncharacterized protein